MVLRKLSEITNNKPIFVLNIKSMNISFFSLRFDLFSIIAKKVNQIRSNAACVVARVVFLFCCALTMDRCNDFQHIFVNLKKSEFYSPYFQALLFLVTLLIMATIMSSKAIKIFVSLLGRNHHFFHKHHP